MIKYTPKNIRNLKILLNNFIEFHRILIVMFKVVPYSTKLKIGDSKKGSFGCFALSKVMYETIKSFKLLVENNHLIQAHVISRSYLEQISIFIILLSDVSYAEKFTDDFLSRRAIKHRDVIKKAARVFREKSGFEDSDWFTQKIVERYKDANKYTHVTEEQLVLSIGAPEELNDKEYEYGTNEQMDLFLTRIYSGSLLFNVYFWNFLYNELIKAKSDNETILGFIRKLEKTLAQTKNVQLI